METCVRYLLMLQLIPLYPKRIGVKQLRQKLFSKMDDCHISERTLQRDLVKLSQFFPLTADNSKPRGWSVTYKSEKFSHMLMSSQLAQALCELEDQCGNKISTQSSKTLAPLFALARTLFDTNDPVESDSHIGDEGLSIHESHMEYSLLAA